MPNQDMTKWAKAIAGRIADEWDGKRDFPDDAAILKNVLATLLAKHPEECRRLIGTGLIEENYFDKCDRGKATPFYPLWVK